MIAQLHGIKRTKHCKVTEEGKPLTAMHDIGISGGFLDPLYYRLAERGIRIPVWSWPSPAGRYFRISAYLYNSIEQYHHLADVIEEELAAERA